jgi:hypothetical protein
LKVTRERWAQIGITVQFLVLVRTLAEFFRLRHAEGAVFSTGAASPFIAGSLIAAICCWLTVTLYFLRRFTISALCSAATIVFLLIYKVVAMG